MRQRDVERVMAAAWEAADVWRPAGLLAVLREVDPNGVYRADAPQSGGDDAHDPTLRQSGYMHTLDSKL